MASTVNAPTEAEFPYAPALTPVVLKAKVALPAADETVSPLPAVIAVMAYEDTLLLSKSVPVLPVSKLISEADAVTRDPAINRLVVLNDPDTSRSYEGLVVPIPTSPVASIYKACKDADDPVVKRPKDEVEIVVSLSKFPPRITVFEELVIPLEKLKGAWYEIVA